MPYGPSGRADKAGNRYEIRVVVFYLLKLLEEKLDYVVLEAIGDDEQGIDLWIGHTNGTKEGIQCKGRNGSKEYWDFGTANSKNIFTNWKAQLERDPLITVSLASPLAFTHLEDLINRAITSNNNGHDFFKHQISSASKDFISFVKNICRVMEIDYESNHDLVRFISYLSKVKYHQIPDTELKDIILSKIEYLFIGEPSKIYDSLVTWIVDGEILGNDINTTMLYEFLKENDHKLKNLALDNRIAPKITELNKEYEKLFKPLNSGIILREEFEECKKSIENGNSLIIHGKAGRGKSGCTQNVIEYCKKENVPYLAIKLDKRVPSCTAEKWGIDLGLPASITHCIHSITKNDNAIIILDQLDALRWTQAHSRDALLVCSQIIEQTARLNIEREKNISIVFVCRTYDLENDNNIKLIFETNSNQTEKLKWNKIQIAELNDNTVQNIIGDNYFKLTNKLKELLRSPSNLYIWQQLDQSIGYNECATTNHLVDKWWEQLTQRYVDLGHNEDELKESKNTLVSKFDELGRICIHKKSITCNEYSLKYLSSTGFLVMQNNKVSFTHQSILDCLLAENMLQQYYSDGNIIEIIGSKEKQTPGRRYQLQMLMQSLIEYESNDFLSAALQILESNDIRFSNKYVVFEILNQVSEIDSNIRKFIEDNCNGKPWSNHLINDVIYSRVQFYRVLRDAGIIEAWFNDSTKKEVVFRLLSSIRPNYDIKDAQFIQQRMFKSQDDDYSFARCFDRDINEDIDEMFELRLQFYQQYPQYANNYLNFKLMVKNCELRTIRYFALLLENTIKLKNKNIHKYEEEFLEDTSEFLIHKSEEVLNILLPFIPLDNGNIINYIDWTCRFHSESIQRVCISIIKKANSALILSNPDLIWKYYESFIGKGNLVYNEILLDAFYKLPTTYSNRILLSLFADIENSIFDKTSGDGDKLGIVKKVIIKHTVYCDDSVFGVIEKKVVEYISSNAIEDYKHRIKYNRENNDEIVYWSFWGDLQYELLQVMPYKRLSDKSKDLLRVLKRKFKKGTNLYKQPSSHGGSVFSPIAGKELTNENWMSIILNNKLKNKKKARWIEIPEGFVESSIREFASSFSSAASKDPTRMLELVLAQETNIDDIFIDSLFSGIAYSDYLGDVDSELIEKIILRYPNNNISYKSSYICTIIEKKQYSKWSEKTINILKDIAINHKNPEIDKPNVTNEEDKEMRSLDMLQSNALNCVRGHAASAIATLLWADSEYFTQFKDTIEQLATDENPAVRFASLSALWPSYNINKKWASEMILDIIEDDYRLAGYHDMKTMFFLLYPEYRERVLNVIEKCYMSEDNDLVKLAAQSLAEMHIRKGEFISEVNSISSMNNNQAEGILLMTMVYFKFDEYNELTKEIIMKFKTSELDLEMPLSRLFYDNLIVLERDCDFLLDVMDSSLGRKTVHSFVHYLEENSKTLIEYKDIILSMSNNIINGTISPEERTWGIGDELSKLIIGLYDEVSNSTNPEYITISNQCLDLWDLMFEKQVGSTRILIKKIMER